MSKQKDQKRKAQLSEKSKNESFKFQVEYARQQKGTFIAADAPELKVEVLEPATLREEMNERINSMFKFYQNN